jgi:hypothetical protein
VIAMLRSVSGHAERATKSPTGGGSRLR